MKVKSVEAKGVLADLLANFNEKEYEEVKKEMIMEIRREEQIKEAAYNNDRESSKENQSYFVDGAEWADENPKEGMINIDKACEWLQYNTMSELCLDLGYTQMVRDFIDNFKKAMEE